MVSLLNTNHFDVTLWDDLGLYLGLHYTTIKKIRIDERDRADACLKECLAAWLSRKDEVDAQGGPTWSSLAKALDQINQPIIATHIRRLFIDNN